MTNRQVACNLVAYGLSVRAMLPSGPKATSREKAVKKIWNQWPDAPIGIGVGVKNGAIAVCVRGKEGRRSWQSIKKSYGAIPATLTVNTPEQKTFLFAPGKLKAVERLELLKGVSVLGEGETVEYTGRAGSSLQPAASTGDASKATLAPLPSWLRRALTKGERPELRPSAIVALSKIKFSNTRRKASVQQVKELAASIKLIGLKTPITVRKVRKGRYDLVAGHHRLEAAKLLGWKRMSCSVLEGDVKDAVRWEISENFHRTELSVLERSEALIRMVDDLGFDQLDQKPKKVRADRLDTKAANNITLPGKSFHAKRHAVARARKIAGLSEEVKKKVKSVGLDNNQKALLKIAVAPVKEQEELIKSLASRSKKTRSDKSERQASDSQILEPKGKAALGRLKRAWSKASKLRSAWTKAKPPVRQRFVKETMGFAA